MTRIDLEHTVNDFVAVRGECCTSEYPFWIGKVQDKLKNKEEVSFQLQMHWFEMYNGSDFFSGK